MSCRFGPIKSSADHVPYNLRVLEIAAPLVAEQDVQRTGL
jgi:hypothetical protein